MRILYITSMPLEINTSASIRNRATIKGLLECGHTVDLLTSLPDKNHIAYDVSLNIPNIHVYYVKIGGIQSVARLGRKYKFLASIKRVVVKYLDSKNIYDNLIGFSTEIIKKNIPININGYDLLISSSDPKSSHLCAYNVIKTKKVTNLIKWIQIWGDPFFGDITLSHKSANLIKKEEKKLIEAADIVFYVSELTMKQQKKMYPNCSHKMRSIPIPYYSEIIYPANDGTNGCEIVYCGDYASNIRNINPLYETVGKMLGVHLTICGNSDVCLKDNDNVTVYPRISQEKAGELEARADVLVCICNLSGTQIPGKIYHYSATNKTILIVLDGDGEQIKSVFEGYQRFVFCDNNMLSIKNAIKRIMNEKSSERNRPVEEFSAENVAKLIMSEI